MYKHRYKEKTRDKEKTQKNIVWGKKKIGWKEPSTKKTDIYIDTYIHALEHTHTYTHDNMQIKRWKEYVQETNW